MDDITLGDTLRFTRMRLKISHEALAGRSNIRIDYIKALEQEDFAALPERPLVRGFIQILAHELGLDLVLLEGKLDQVWKPQELRYHVWKEPETGFLWELAPIFPVVIILALVGWLVFSAIHASSSGNLEAKPSVLETNVQAKTIPLSVKTVPPGAYVYLDRGFIGLSPITNFPITQRLRSQLRIIKAGFKPYQDSLELIEGHSIDINLEVLPAVNPVVNPMVIPDAKP